MKKLTAIFLLASGILAGAVAGSSVAVATDSDGARQNKILDHCQYLPLATNLEFPKHSS